MLGMLVGLTEAHVIIISIYLTEPDLRERPALGHSAEELHFLHRHAFKTLVCFLECIRSTLFHPCCPEQTLFLNQTIEADSYVL